MSESLFFVMKHTIFFSLYKINIVWCRKCEKHNSTWWRWILSPGMCPDGELNQQRFTLWDDVQNLLSIMYLFKPLHLDFAFERNIFFSLFLVLALISRWLQATYLSEFVITWKRKFKVLQLSLMTYHDPRSEKSRSPCTYLLMESFYPQGWLAL